MFDVHTKNSGSFRDFTRKNIIRLSFRGVILISGINIVMASLRVLFCVVLPRPRLLSTLESLAAKHSFVSFQTRTNLSEFQLHGVFWSDNLEKVVSTDKIWWIQTEIKVW